MKDKEQNTPKIQQENQENQKTQEIGQTASSFPDEFEIDKALADEKKGEKSKEKRGRKKKGVKEKEQQFAIVLTQAFDNLVTFPFDFLAERRGDFWRLSIDEKKSLSQATQGIANKYIPNILEKWSDELFFLVVLSVILYPRTLEDMKQTKEMNEKIEKANREKMENQDPQ